MILVTELLFKEKIKYYDKNSYKRCLFMKVIIELTTIIGQSEEITPESFPHPIVTIAFASDTGPE